MTNEKNHDVARTPADVDNTTAAEAANTAQQDAWHNPDALSQDPRKRAQATLEIMRSQLAASADSSLHDTNASLYDDQGLPL